MSTRVSTKQYARLDTLDKDTTCIFCSRGIPAGESVLKIGITEAGDNGITIHGELHACSECLKNPKIARLRKMQNGRDFKMADYLANNEVETPAEPVDEGQAPAEPEKPKKQARQTVTYEDCLRAAAKRSLEGKEVSQHETPKASESEGGAEAMSDETAKNVLEAMKPSSETMVKVPEAAIARAETLVADMVRASNNMSRMLLEQDKQAEKFVRAASVLISMTEENRSKAIQEAREILGAADGLRDSATDLKEAAEGLPMGVYEDIEEPEPTWKTASRLGIICVMGLICGWAIYSAAPGAEVILNSVGLHVSNLGSLAIFGCAGIGLLVSCCCMAVEGVKATTKRLAKEAHEAKKEDTEDK